MGKIISKSLVLWGILTIVAVLFAMASIGHDGLSRYVYFIVSIVSCYGIRMFAKKEGVKNVER